MPEKFPAETWFYNLVTFMHYPDSSWMCGLLSYNCMKVGDQRQGLYLPLGDYKRLPMRAGFNFGVLVIKRGWESEWKGIGIEGVL